MLKSNGYIVNDKNNNGFELQPLRSYEKGNKLWLVISSIQADSQLKGVPL